MELAPDDPESNQQYAEMLAGMGRIEEALPYARRAAELDPLAAIRLNALGYILWHAGRPDESLATWRAARSFVEETRVAAVAPPEAVAQPRAAA